MGSLELKIPPLAWVLLFAAAMGILSILTPALSLSLPYLTAVALGFSIAGAGIAALGVASFRRAGTSVNPMKPAGTASLVDTGIYRLTRNPMYLGFLLALIGWALWLASAVALLLAPAFVWTMNRLQIAPEERALQALFGTEFAAYCARVRRWL